MGVYSFCTGWCNFLKCIFYHETKGVRILLENIWVWACAFTWKLTMRFWQKTDEHWHISKDYSKILKILDTRRKFLREILYKNIAIIAIQHSNMYLVDTSGDFSHTVGWNSLKFVWRKMSYSIVLLSNLFFHFLKIIWILKICNNFSDCKILIFTMVK